MTANQMDGFSWGLNYMEYINHEIYNFFFLEDNIFHQKQFGSTLLQTFKILDLGLTLSLARWVLFFEIQFSHDDGQAIGSCWKLDNETAKQMVCTSVRSHKYGQLCLLPLRSRSWTPAQLLRGTFNRNSVWSDVSRLFIKFR